MKTLEGEVEELQNKLALQEDESKQLSKTIKLEHTYGVIKGDSVCPQLNK